MTFGNHSDNVVIVSKKVIIVRWSRNLAYIVGLITTDGSLSSDARHIDFTSKDLEQVQTFIEILEINNKIGLKSREAKAEKIYYHVQFGNVKFYKFLQEIGLTPNKSLTLDSLKIPDKFFPDFLRGYLDGDGNISIVNHPESKHKQLRLRLTSASLNHLIWLKESIQRIYSIQGGFIYKSPKGVGSLIYAKADSIKLLEYIYPNDVKYFLKRKFEYYQKFAQVMER